MICATQEAAQALIYAGMAGSKLEGIQDKVNEYLDRVQALHNAGRLTSQETTLIRDKLSVNQIWASFHKFQIFTREDVFIYLTSHASILVQYGNHSRFTLVINL